MLPPLARWALDLRVPLPVRPLFRLFGGVNEWWELLIAFAVGVLLGFGIAVVAISETATVTIGGAEVRFDRDEWSETVKRFDVAAVFVDGKQIVVLDRESRRVVSEEPKAPTSALAEAFRAHGYPWHGYDPYVDLYRRWTAGTPELPPVVNAVLAARQVALKKKVLKDARNLRGAIEELGFSVRDEGTEQYWRPLVRS